MNIIVPVKTNPDLQMVRIKNREPVLEAVPYKLGDLDKNAMEAALQLQAALGDTKVIALTIAQANRKIKDTMKEALAMGADEAYIVSDPALVITDQAAKAAVRRSSTTIAALMLKLGDADAMLCGLLGRFDVHLDHIHDVIGVKKGASGFATLNALMLEKRTLFIADTFVNEDPDAAQLASIAVMAADEVRRFGLPPKVAFLSHSMYGSSNRKSAVKMRLAHELFCKLAPDVESDGELHGDAALSEDMRHAALMDSKFHGEANVLICPNLDAANILFNVLKVTGGNGVTVGPILLGANASAHVLTPSSTVRRVVNMTALAVANAAHGAGAPSVN